MVRGFPRHTRLAAGRSILNATTQRGRAAPEAMRFLMPGLTSGLHLRAMEDGRSILHGLKHRCVVALKNEFRGACGFARETTPFSPNPRRPTMFLTCSYFTRIEEPCPSRPDQPARAGILLRSRMGASRQGSGLHCEALAEQYGRREVIRERLSSRHRRAVQRCPSRGGSRRHEALKAGARGVRA